MLNLTKTKVVAFIFSSENFERVLGTKSCFWCVTSHILSAANILVHFTRTL